MTAARLACRVTARPHRPAANGRVAVVVHTSARAHIIASDLRTGVTHRGRADASGNLTVHFTAGPASAGSRTVVRVHATLNGRSTSCQAAFRLALAPAVARPSTQPAAAPSSAPTATAPKPQASCYPLSDEGTCYEPGEYCRDSDHGLVGVAGDGEQITCEDNDGWRWEPS